MSRLKTVRYWLEKMGNFDTREKKCFKDNERETVAACVGGTFTERREREKLLCLHINF